jgi:hypothetical protein
MEEMKYERIAEVMGRGHADMVQSYLEAEGIPVELIQESASHSSYVTPFAAVEIFVPKAHAQRARELIRGLDGVVETKEDE